MRQISKHLKHYGHLLGKHLKEHGRTMGKRLLHDHVIPHLRRELMERVPEPLKPLAEHAFDAGMKRLQ